MGIVATFLQKLGFVKPPTFTPEDVERAYMENALWENERAFKRITDATQEGVSRANVRLKRTADRIRENANNPFADLENLTKMKRDVGGRKGG